MHHSDRQLSALFRRMMDAPTDTPVYAPAQDEKVARDNVHAEEEPAWQAKADAERGELGCGQRESQQNTTRSKLKRLGLVGLLSLAFLSHSFWPAVVQHAIPHDEKGLDELCPQVDPITPYGYKSLLESLDKEYATTTFKLKAYESLGGAVRIPTECFDDLGPTLEDPRWDIEYKFHEYLESRFPRVHATLRRTKIETFALVYEWEGSDDTLKPLLLAAHMDVVPVNPATYDDWVNPPYSGYFDGEWIWGRGSCDDKPGVIGSMTAIESLLERGFVPARTVLLAFGIDEERGGNTGARAIGKYLLDTFGPDSLAMIVDEGGGYSNEKGIVIAGPAVAEKGYMDVRMDVFTPGGHSTIDKGIGILADLVTEQGLECRAKYDKGFPKSMRKLVQQSRGSDAKLRELAERLLDFDPLYYAQAGTTQAIDIVGGGVKVNALPEAVFAIANHRIADHSSTTELMDRFAGITTPVAAKHNMSLDAFGKKIGADGPSWGTIRLSDAFGSALEPAPVTPTTGSGPYELLSGTIIATLESNLRTDNFPKSAVVAPALSLGNTDTRHYWNLTKHIFRYGHRGTADSYNGAHTVNEAIRAQGFLEQIRFFTRLILNADQSDSLE